MGSQACSIKTENKKNTFDYLCNYINACWENRQYYKNEQNKLLYWTGSIFAAIIAGSGLLGAFLPKNTDVAFTYFHTTVFHVMFLIIWFYFLYKQLSADMYEKIGLEGEKAIEKLYGKILPEVPSFFEIKGHYLGKQNNICCGRHLTIVANWLIIILYAVVVTAPIWKGKLASGTLTLDIKNIISIILLLIFIAIGQIIYQVSKKKIYTSIEQEWQSFIEHHQTKESTTF